MTVHTAKNYPGGIEKVGDSISLKNKELKKLFLKAFFTLDYSEISDLTKDQIIKMAYSKNVQQNITATKYLYRYNFKGDNRSYCTY